MRCCANHPTLPRRFARTFALLALLLLGLQSPPPRAQVILGDTGLVRRVVYGTSSGGETTVVELNHQSNAHFIYQLNGGEVKVLYAATSLDSARDSAVLIVRTYVGGKERMSRGEILITVANGIPDTLALIRPLQWTIDLTYDVHDSLWHGSIAPRLMNWSVVHAGPNAGSYDSTNYSGWTLHSTEIAATLRVSSFSDSARVLGKSDSVVVAPHADPRITIGMTSASGLLGRGHDVDATLTCRVSSASGSLGSDSLWTITVTLRYNAGPVGQPIVCDSSECRLYSTTNMDRSALLTFAIAPSVTSLYVQPPYGFPWQIETVDSTRERLVVQVTLLPTTCGIYRDTLELTAVWTDYQGESHSARFPYPLTAFISNDGEPIYWEQVHGPLPGASVQMEVDPFGNLISFGSACWISEDRGVTWRDTHQAISSLGIARTGELLAVSGNTVVYSSDRGNSWTTVAIPFAFTGSLEGSLEGIYHIGSITYYPVACAILSPDILQVSCTGTGSGWNADIRSDFTFGRMFKTTDRGVHWTSTDVKQMYDRANPWEHMLRDSGDRLITWASGDGYSAVAISPIYGWVDVYRNQGFYQGGARGFNLYHISVSHRGDVFAVGSNAGVFHLAPGDSVYRGMNVGLPTRNVTAIATAPDGTTYAYIPEFGVYRSVPSALTVAAQRVAEMHPGRIVTTDPTTHFTLPCDVRSVRVFDLRGTPIASNIHLQSNDLDLATTALPAGLYFVEIETSCGRETREILKVR